MRRKFRSEKIAKRHRKLFWIKVSAYFLVFIFCFSLLIYFSRNEKIEIREINIIGNRTIPSEKILELVNQNLIGNYWMLFPRKNSLIYSKNKIEEALKKNFLKINKVAISRKDWQSIDINIQEHEVFALYCREQEQIKPDLIPNPTKKQKEDGGVEILSESSNSIDEQIQIFSEDCYFMNDQAYIFAEAMNFSDNIYFKYQDEILARKEVKDIPGSSYLDSDREDFERVNLFVRYLRDINIDAYSLMVKKDGDYILSFNDSSSLIFDKKQNLDILVENLQAVLIELGDIDGRKFEYIDLRFDNKLLYKFKHEEETEINE